MENGCFTSICVLVASDNTEFIDESDEILLLVDVFDSYSLSNNTDDEEDNFSGVC